MICYHHKFITDFCLFNYTQHRFNMINCYCIISGQSKLDLEFCACISIFQSLQGDIWKPLSSSCDSSIQQVAAVIYQPQGTSSSVDQIICVNCYWRISISSLLLSQAVACWYGEFQFIKLRTCDLGMYLKKFVVCCPAQLR